MEITMEAEEEAMVYPTSDTIHHLPEALPPVQIKVVDLVVDVVVIAGILAQLLRLTNNNLACPPFN